MLPDYPLSRIIKVGDGMDVFISYGGCLQPFLAESAEKSSERSQVWCVNDAVLDMESLNDADWKEGCKDLDKRLQKGAENEPKGLANGLKRKGSSNSKEDSWEKEFNKREHLKLQRWKKLLTHKHSPSHQDLPPTPKPFKSPTPAFQSNKRNCDRFIIKHQRFNKKNEKIVKEREKFAEMCKDNYDEIIKKRLEKYKECPSSSRSHSCSKTSSKKSSKLQDSIIYNENKYQIDSIIENTEEIAEPSNKKHKISQNTNLYTRSLFKSTAEPSFPYSSMHNSSVKKKQTTKQGGATPKIIRVTPLETAFFDIKPEEDHNSILNSGRGRTHARSSTVAVDLPSKDQYPLYVNNRLESGDTDVGRFQQQDLIRMNKTSLDGFNIRKQSDGYRETHDSFFLRSPAKITSKPPTQLTASRPNHTPFQKAPHLPFTTPTLPKPTPPSSIFTSKQSYSQPIPIITSHLHKLEQQAKRDAELANLNLTLNRLKNKATSAVFFQGGWKRNNGARGRDNGNDRRSKEGRCGRSLASGNYSIGQKRSDNWHGGTTNNGTVIIIGGKTTY